MRSSLKVKDMKANNAADQAEQLFYGLDAISEEDHRARLYHPNAFASKLALRLRDSDDADLYLYGLSLDLEAVLATPTSILGEMLQGVARQLLNDLKPAIPAQVVIK